jgi:transcriptional regulator with XRE-family HTH domain
MTDLAARPPRVGSLLRDWRQRRRLSQLDLALQAGVSARHVSFVETGRSRPSPEMVLHLADELDVPLRDRNDLLLAAGYAPVFGQHGLDEPELEPVRDALDAVLRGHEPNPTIVVDRHWGLVASNGATGVLTDGIDPDLLAPPANVLRASLHPDGLAPRILNLGEWRGHLLHRLARQATASGDPALHALHEELRGYSSAPVPDDAPTTPTPAIATPLRLRDGDAELTFLSTITTFGTATEVTVAELSIESFLPADAATAAALRDRQAAQAR